MLTLNGMAILNVHIDIYVKPFIVASRYLDEMATNFTRTINLRLQIIIKSVEFFFSLKTFN